MRKKGDNKVKVNNVKLNLFMVREKINFTELAKVSGVSRPTLSYINNGKHCRMDVVCKIAEALNIEPEELIQK